MAAGSVEVMVKVGTGGGFVELVSANQRLGAPT